MEHKSILVPYDPREALSVKEAAGIAGRSEATVRTWCDLNHIGRRVPVNGPWRVSRVALQMLLDGNAEALAAYHRGERKSSPLVQYYFTRAGLTPPEDMRPESIGEATR